jgi:nucleotide-binding universal stress UspA family protein
MRTLLIVDGTNSADEALRDARILCDPGDKLTVLAVAEKPPAELLGTQPGPAATEPYTGGAVGGIASGSPDVPIIESDDATERRVAGELRDELDQHTARLDSRGVEIWTQAIVRDAPGEAVAAYVRSSDVNRIVLPRSSIDRIRELLDGTDGKKTLEGELAPVIILPS